MQLPFTSDQFFEVFAAYNRSLWPAALALWLYAAVGLIVLARFSATGSRFLLLLLAVQWGWAALAYHFAFFTRVNPAAWWFGGLFLAQSALFGWLAVGRPTLRFSPTGSARHVVAWTLLIYSLAYPLIVRAEGHVFPAVPTFGVPCPTTLLTLGFLLAVDAPWPRAIAVIPVVWSAIAGSAAIQLGVRADLMLWVGGLALTWRVLVQRGPAAPAIFSRRSRSFPAGSVGARRE